MARIVRVMAAGTPHHVTQRGKQRQKTFFSDADCESYCALLAEGFAPHFASCELLSIVSSLFHLLGRTKINFIL